VHARDTAARRGQHLTLDNGGIERRQARIVSQHGAHLRDRRVDAEDHRDVIDLTFVRNVECFHRGCEQRRGATDDGQQAEHLDLAQT
jgi:hypothetical protein